MKRLLFAILLISATAFAQDYASRDEMLLRVRYQDRMANDTFAVHDYELIPMLNEGVKATVDKLRPYQKLDTIWTTGGTATYALNSDCYYNGVKAVYVLTDSTNGIYQAVRSTLSRDIGQTSAEPEPSNAIWYTIYADRIRLEPTPSETYRVEIDYEARPDVYGADTSDSGDTILAVKPEYEQLVIDYTRHLLKKRFGLYGEAADLKEKWKVDIAESRALLSRQPDPMVSPQKERGL